MTFIVTIWMLCSRVLATCRIASAAPLREPWMLLRRIKFWVTELDFFNGWSESGRADFHFPWLLPPVLIDPLIKDGGGGGISCADDTDCRGVDSCTRPGDARANSGRDGNNDDRGRWDEDVDVEGDIDDGRKDDDGSRNGIDNTESSERDKRSLQRSTRLITELGSEVCVSTGVKDMPSKVHSI